VLARYPPPQIGAAGHRLQVDRLLGFDGELRVRACLKKKICDESRKLYFLICHKSMLVCLVYRSKHALEYGFRQYLRLLRQARHSSSLG
jgi:hypothetical protein